MTAQAGAPDAPGSPRTPVRAATAAALAAAYLLVGAAGLALEIPAGFASPVFPAAGLALAAVLWYGRPALAAVWAGATVLNLGHTWLAGHLGAAGTLAGLVIAGGAALQAAAGAWLVERRLGPAWRTLANESEALRFLFLGGVLAALVSASVGVGVLAVTGLIPGALVPFAWWTWYLGDTLGILVFAPLTLALLDRSDPLWRERRRRLLAPMLLTLGLIALAFYGAARGERQVLANQVATDGQGLAKGIADRLVTHREVLSSLRHFIEATPAFTDAQFEQFTRRTLDDNPDIFALSFNARVTEAERPAFERQMATWPQPGAGRITELDAARQLVPAGSRPEYVVVRHIAPLAGNARALGYDIGSEPTRRAAVEQARATLAMAVTAPIQLVQEDRQRPGVLELLPILETGGGHAIRLSGFAVGVIKIDELVAIATRGQVPDGLLVQLSDPRAAPGSGLLYRSDGGTEESGPARLDLSWTTALRMGDRRWQLQVTPTDDYRQRHRPWVAWAAGIVGLLVVALLQVLMLGMTGRTMVIQRQNQALKASEERIARYRDRLEDLVEQRTRQLADANRFLRTLTDHLPSMVAYWDRDQHCRFANEVYRKWFGLGAQTMVGTSMRAALGEDLHRQNEPLILAALRGEPQQFERTLVKADGSTGYALVDYIPDIPPAEAPGRDPGGASGAPSPRGEVRGLVALVTDVSEMKRAQLELERLNRELAEHSRRAESANQAKSAFLAHMSHEIRTPLNGILGMAELALDAPLVPAVRESLETIRHSGEALLSILNDILDFSKIEAGRLDLEELPFDLPDLVRLTLATLRPAADLKGLELRADLDPELPAVLRGDPGRLRQVLLNLVGNALKFTDQGGVTVRVRPRGCADGRARLQFEVTDTGIGIEPDKQRHIFEPFAQEDVSITRRYGGTGLGLSITARLVRLMGGEIGLDSAPGAGSTFHFTLTLALADAPAATPAAAPREPGEGTAAVSADPAPRALRVLLVEDNLVNQKVGLGMLRRLGHRVSVAADGEEALAALAAEPFDLVLMDMQMPVMDGLEATRRLRAREADQGLPRTRVIAITANAMASDQALCLAAGMDGFISKPLVAAALKAELDRV